MTNFVENIDNEYVLTIRENNKRPDIKVIKHYINKNFAIDLEEELIESTVMGLLDHNIIETHPHPKGIPILLEKRIILQ